MLGALFTFLLFVIIYYDRDLIKKYRMFLKTKNCSIFKGWEFVIFCVLNFATVWILIFGILCATVNWRVLSSEDNAVIALCAGLLFIGIVMYTYRTGLKISNLTSRLLKSQKIPSRASLPNTNDSTVKFNYFYAFKYIPEIIDKYNLKQSTISSIFDILTILRQHPEFSDIAKNIEYGISEGKKDKNIKALAIAIPNTQTISEVEIAYVVFDERINKAVYYTLEKSIGGYAIASPTSDGKHHLIDFVDSPQQFVEKILPIAMDELTGNSEIAKYTTSTSAPIVEESSISPQNKAEITVKSTTPLFEFAKRYKHFKIGSFKNESNESSKRCLFFNDTNSIVEVHFSSRYGELTPEQIKNQKDSLQIVELSNGKYILTRKGTSGDNQLYDLNFVKDTIETITNGINHFFESCSLTIKFPSFTHHELMLFISALVLGHQNVQKLRIEKDTLFWRRLYSLFLGADTPLELVKRMQGMSVPCIFFDTLNRTAKLADRLNNCTSVSIEEKTWNGKKVRMLNLFVSMNFFTYVHLSNELNDISLQDVFERKNELFINETCEQTSPSPFCTPMEEWPILETVNRSEKEFERFIQDFMLDRIERYYKVFTAMHEKKSFMLLANALLVEPFNVESDAVFSYEFDYAPPLNEKELRTFKCDVDDLITFVLSDNKLP